MVAGLVSDPLNTHIVEVEVVLEIEVDAIVETGQAILAKSQTQQVLMVNPPSVIFVAAHITGLDIVHMLLLLKEVTMMKVKNMK